MEWDPTECVLVTRIAVEETGHVKMGQATEYSV